MASSLRIEQHGPDVLISIKAVPGASRDAIAGVLGERLKVRVSAPAEGGKANRAICKLLASAVGVRRQEVTIESGHASAEKVIRISSMAAADVARFF